MRKHAKSLLSKIIEAFKKYFYYYCLLDCIFNYSQYISDFFRYVIPKYVPLKKRITSSHLSREERILIHHSLSALISSVSIMKRTDPSTPSGIPE
jgi:hypothetical protein